MLEKISYYLTKHSIYNHFVWHNKIIIRQSCYLDDDIFNNIDLIDLNYCVFEFDLTLISRYLPKGFYLEVKGEIYAPELKSKLLKDLIRNPGPSRQLAFNLLKSNNF